MTIKYTILPPDELVPDRVIVRLPDRGMQVAVIQTDEGVVADIWDTTVDEPEEPVGTTWAHVNDLEGKVSL